MRTRMAQEPGAPSKIAACPTPQPAPASSAWNPKSITLSLLRIFIYQFTTLHRDGLIPSQHFVVERCASTCCFCNFHKGMRTTFYAIVPSCSQSNTSRTYYCVDLSCREILYKGLVWLAYALLTSPVQCRLLSVC